MFEAISRSKVSCWPSWVGAPVRRELKPESYNTHVRVDAMREMRIAEEQRIELLLWVDQDRIIKDKSQR